jgi:hypothetical protein
MMGLSVVIHAAGNARGLVRYEFIPEGHTENKERYIKILHCLRDTVRMICPEKWA